MIIDSFVCLIVYKTSSVLSSLLCMRNNYSLLYRSAVIIITHDKTVIKKNRAENTQAEGKGRWKVALATQAAIDSTWSSALHDIVHVTIAPDDLSQKMIILFISPQWNDRRRSRTFQEVSIYADAIPVIASTVNRRLPFIHGPTSSYKGFVLKNKI